MKLNNEKLIKAAEKLYLQKKPLIIFHEDMNNILQVIEFIIPFFFKSCIFCLIEKPG